MIPAGSSGAGKKAFTGIWVPACKVSEALDLMTPMLDWVSSSGQQFFVLWFAI